MCAEVREALQAERVFLRQMPEDVTPCLEHGECGQPRVSGVGRNAAARRLCPYSGHITALRVNFSANKGEIQA
jgi:hypothetical protein